MRMELPINKVEFALKKVCAYFFFLYGEIPNC